jgi:hypothetical protein
VAGEGFAHAGETHVLAEESGYFEVELVEGYDAVEFLLACEIADSVEDLLWGKFLRHGVEFGEGFVGPVCLF